MNQKADSPDELAKRTWNQSYELSASPNLWGAEPVPFVFKAIEVFKANHIFCVLDLPCGDGRNAVPLAKNLPFVIGGDASPNALRIAAKSLSFHQVQNCLLLECDIFDSKFLDNQFDGVFCWDVLGHLINPRSAIEELLRICKPGGVVIGSVFSLGDSTRGKDMTPTGGEEEYIYADKFYFKFYDELQVKDLLQPFNAATESLELATWMEPPHEGYREYAHEHQSWVFTIRKAEE